MLDVLEVKLHEVVGMLFINFDKFLLGSEYNKPVSAVLLSFCVLTIVVSKDKELVNNREALEVMNCPKQDIIVLKLLMNNVWHLLQISGIVNLF